MRRLAARFAIAALVLAVPTIAQMGEANTYFSLSSEKTFGSAEKPRVRLWGHGFERLQFRVYRVNDPLQFFRQLEDPNNFGGQPPRRPEQLTLLERFRRWKLASRTHMRNVVRRQFTQDSRENIREAFTRREQQSPLKGTTPEKYAAVPVLNQQQVVAVWEQPRAVKESWESQFIPVDVKDRGVYLVEATDGKLQAYTIVIVTDLVMITKTAQGAVLARTLDRKTGQAVAGASVYGFSNKQEFLRVESNAQGFVEVTPKAGGAGDALLLARHGADIAPAVISEWSLREGGSAGESVTAYVYTDRPVYRPTHQVHFRAIVRARGTTAFKLPADEDMDLQIDDPEGNPVLRRRLRPNEIGTVSGDMSLPATAALGYYGISLRKGDQYAGSGGFHVEEYRKPEYAVKVTPQQPRTLQGSTIRATIEARYYFGEPVPAARVTYVVHRARYWSPYYMEEGEEAIVAEGDDEYLQNEQILEQTGTLDAEGKLTIEFPAESAKHDLRYRIEARVTDQANREVSGTGVVLATRAPFYLHAEPDKYVYAAGDQAQIRVEARDYDGNYVPDIDFQVAVLKDKGATVVSRASGRTGANGVGSAGVRLNSGLLIARVSAKTSDGREVDDDAYLWVSGGDASLYERQQRVEIVPDKKSYVKGEVAKLLIVTGVPNASVWVTAETGGILVSQVVDARGPTASFDLPIRADYAPNIYVNASFVRDGQMFMGMKSVRVPPAEQTLNVAIKTSKEQFKPGERGAVTVEAKDFAGKPVSGEFSVGIVDEAIYAIRREAAEDILSFFYGRRHNAVFTTSSLSYSFHGSSGKRRMQLAGLNGSRRAQLKPDRFVDPRVRKAFPDTIYWSAAVRTGPDGRAEVPVTFPDSLTTWRTTVRGITADTRVGSAVERTIVRKNLILRIAAPRFFMEGDEVTVSAIVQNYLASEKTVRVSLEMQGLDMVQGETRDVNVPSRGSATVEYRVRASKPGSAILAAKALTDEESDAMELTLPVKPYGVKLSEAKTGSLTGESAQVDATLTFPPEANPASRKVEITVSPSVAGTLFSALEYLTSYPYGCTEQTMSSFLPNVIVSRAGKELGVQTGIDEAELVKKIRAGLDRLYDFQHEDGGWGWWKTDDGSLFMSAYVVSGLVKAKAAGYAVKPESIGKAVTWIKTQLPNEKQLDPDLRAYIAYTLLEAGQPDAALIDTVWNDRSRLSPFGLAFLGLAAHAQKSDRAGTIASEIERQARSSDQEVWWDVQSDPLLAISWDTSPEATAYVLHFLTLQKPDSALLPKAAVYLVNHRNGGYYWSSTKQTAMVIYGLTGYLRSTKELQADFTATVLVNGNAVATKRLTGAQALTGAVPIVVPAAQLNAAGNTVRVTKSGKGVAYWSARAEYFSTADRIVRPGSGALGVTREFFKMSPEQRGDKIVYRLDPLGASVDRGDLIAVRLKVTGTDWKYLLIEDPIPAGTEFITRDDLYELERKPDWWARWTSRREYHDDRAALFDTWFRSGETEYSYILKVVNPGKYRLPPARVEPMYQPNVFATSDGRSLEVR
jgi:alpha-2-macroglobulin